MAARCAIKGRNNIKTNKNNIATAEAGDCLLTRSIIVSGKILLETNVLIKFIAI